MHLRSSSKSKELAATRSAAIQGAAAAPATAGPAVTWCSRGHPQRHDWVSPRPRTQPGPSEPATSSRQSALGRPLPPGARGRPLQLHTQNPTGHRGENCHLGAEKPQSWREAEEAARPSRDRAGSGAPSPPSRRGGAAARFRSLRGTPANLVPRRPPYPPLRPPLRAASAAGGARFWTAMSLWVDKYRPGALGRLDYHREQAAQLRNLVRPRGPFPGGLSPAPPLAAFSRGGGGRLRRARHRARSFLQRGSSRIRGSAARKAAPAGLQGRGWELSLGAGPALRRSFPAGCRRWEGRPLASRPAREPGLCARLRGDGWLDFLGSDAHVRFLLVLSENDQYLWEQGLPCVLKVSWRS